MSPNSKNPQHQDSGALDVESGEITCGSTARRKLYELEGVDERVRFVGDALDAGRQADEDEYPRESPPEASSGDKPREHVDEEVKELVENTKEADVDE